MTRPVLPSTSRALRAAMAVTLGITGCSRVGVDPLPDTGVAPDATSDVTTDAVADAAETVENPCSAVADSICPDVCTQDTDADCCNRIDLCDWTGRGCGCAVEGPFAPPTTRLRSPHLA
jgi:hypothetical protein